jgi:D-glycero-alpha-D-manno-heptose-7-phosphate kinase
MIITRTPFRLSFFGGGTDYPSWYLQRGGAVLSAAINKYCYLTVRYKPPFHEHRYRIVYRKIETLSAISEIQHPAVRAVLSKLDVQRGLEVHHTGDLPARAGMGSSSAFTVGLLHAVHARGGHLPDKHALALEAIEVEQEILGETVGSQDQIAAAYGGMNRIDFRPSGEIEVHPLGLSPERTHALQSHLMLFYTGVSRTAQQVARSYVTDIHTRAAQLEPIHELVGRGVTVLEGAGDIQDFGALLHEAWLLKRALSPRVSNSHIDDIYRTARDAGAIGGKLLGAGGGGFLLFFVPPAKAASLRAALSELIYVPVGFDTEGSKIIFSDPGEDWEELDNQHASQTIRPFVEHDTLLTEGEDS